MLDLALWNQLYQSLTFLTRINFLVHLLPIKFSLAT